MFFQRFGCFGLSLLLISAVNCVAAERRARGADEDERSDAGIRNRSGREAGQKEKGDGELEDVMDEMNGNFRKIRRQVSDKSQNASSLTLAANLVRLTQKATQLTPRLITQAPEKDRAAMLASYRDQIQELAATFADLQAALKDGKNGKAAEIVEDLRELESVGHRKFRAKDAH